MSGDWVASVGGQARVIPRRRPTQLTAQGHHRDQDERAELPRLGRPAAQHDVLHQLDPVGHRQHVGEDPDGLAELRDGQHEAAEEDRREEQQQRELDRLPLRVGDDRDEQPDPERGEQHEADGGRQGRPDRPASGS